MSYLVFKLFWDQQDSKRSSALAPLLPRMYLHKTDVEKFNYIGFQLMKPHDRKACYNTWRTISAYNKTCPLHHSDSQVTASLTCI